jgi:hypothetical protein
MWNSYLRDNINKLLDRGHRVLTVAQFTALVTPEGTKGTLAPDEVYLEVDSANGIEWHLAFESGETTYKWRFLGGPPLSSEVATAEATSSATYVALATAGPSITLPRSGDYDVEIAAQGSQSGGTVGRWMSYDIGGTGAVDADGSNTDGKTIMGKARRKTGLTPVALTAKYKTDSGSHTFSGRRMTVSPSRIRHDA